MNGFGAVISGLVYGSLRKRIGLWVVPVGLLSVSFGFLTVALVDSIAVAMVGSTMVGFSIRMVIPAVLSLAEDI